MFVAKKSKLWAVLLVAVGALLFVGGPSKAFASNTLLDAQHCQDSLVFIDIAHIQCTLTDGTTKVTFLDNNPTDNNHNSNDKFSHLTYEQTDYSNMCNPGNFDEGAFLNKPGVTRPNGSGGNFTLDDSLAPHSFNLNFGYFSGKKCIAYRPKDSIIKDTIGISAFLQIDGNNISSIDGVNKGSLGGHVYTPILDSSGNSTGGYSDGDYISCDGNLLLTTVQNKTETRSANFALKSGTIDANKYPTVAAYFTKMGMSKCSVKDSSSDINFGLASADATFAVLSVPSDALTGLSSATSSSKSCEEVGGSLSFVMCPLITGIGNTLDWLNGTVADQLQFDVNKDFGQAGDKTKSVDNNPVKDVWNTVRNIASIFLVVIAMVMVLSQALSFGPFDAYAVKKTLPRLVIAIIFMQLSWVLLSFAINALNSIGSDIAALIYGPFGGPDKFRLENLMADQMGTGASAGLVAGTAIATSIGFLFAGFASGAFVYILVFLFITLLPIVLFGFVTLAIRKALIIAMIMFAPLAIVLWVLPGTQKIWRLWKDNITKLLMLFPIIMALLAIGRVFAFIAASSVTGNAFLQFIAIMIGYFAPFLYLPKTLKWGGNLLQMAGGAVDKVGKMASKPAEGFLKNQQKRSRWTQGRALRNAELDRRAQMDFGNRLSENSLRGRTARARLYGIGRPRNEGQIADRASSSGQVVAIEAETKRASEVMATYMRDGNIAGIQMIAEHSQSQIEREVALAQLAKANAFDSLRAYKQGAQFDQATWDSMLRKNPDVEKTLMEKASDLGTIGSPPRAGVAESIRSGDIASASLGTVDETFLTNLAGESAGWTPGQPLDEAQARSVTTLIERIARDPGTVGRLTDTERRLIDQTLASTTRTLRRPTVNFQRLIDSQGRSPRGPQQTRAGHEATFDTTLPDATTLMGLPATDPTVIAYRSKLLRDENARTALANGIAYDVGGAARAPERAAQLSVLADMHAEFTAPGATPSPEDVGAFNDLVTSMQAAERQRIDEAVQRSIDQRGYTPAQAQLLRTQLEASRAPRLATYESLRIP